MIEQVVATRFEKVMSSGRTNPCLLTCETESGDEVEVVMKLRSHPQVFPGAFCSEAFCCLLADDLDLPVQKPYRVMIDQAFAKTIPDPSLRDRFEKSAGENFGCAKWGQGFTIWPKNKKPTKETKSLVMEIFAFDAVIQNPDRKYSTPNLSFKGNDFIVFDHEAAFSNFRSFLPADPWSPSGVDFLKTHIFYQALKGGDLRLERFQGGLVAVNEKRMDAYQKAIPSKWECEMINGDKIRSYLLECGSNFDQIKMQMEVLL